MVAQPGGADRGRHRLGRPAADPRGRAGQPREPLELEGLPARPEGERGLQGRRVRRRRRPCRARGRDRARCCPEAAWQRCYVHFLRNALDHLPRKADDDCLQELRWLYDRRDLAEAKADLAAWLAKWSAKLSAPHRLGRGEHRGDLHLLPPAAPAPQAPEVAPTCSSG